MPYRIPRNLYTFGPQISNTLRPILPYQNPVPPQNQVTPQPPKVQSQSPVPSLSPYTLSDLQNSMFQNRPLFQPQPVAHQPFLPQNTMQPSAPPPPKLSAPASGQYGDWGGFTPQKTFPNGALVPFGNTATPQGFQAGNPLSRLWPMLQPQTQLSQPFMPWVPTSTTASRPFLPQNTMQPSAPPPPKLSAPAPGQYGDWRDFTPQKTFPNGTLVPFGNTATPQGFQAGNMLGVAPR